jgi:ABC-2 type transport system ATP-binding protein
MYKQVLEVKNLTKKYGSFTAVDDISFSIQESEIVGLLGPNGAGKTTTIQMLLGVLSPTHGEIKYFGKNFTTHREEILEKVNFSSTYTNLPWRLTVRENLMWVAYLYDFKKRKERVEEIIEIFKLHDMEKKSIAQLSAGQKTRVNLAKSFINAPKILLLDEPTASMDPDNASYLREIILVRKKEQNMSLIWTSHNMAEVEEMCDRVVFINKGKVIADDKPEVLAKSIKNAHVALVIRDGLKRAAAFAEKEKFAYHIDKRAIIVDVEEHKIANFLQKLTDKGITYDEISIEKPTLEDYFLEAAKK